MIITIICVGAISPEKEVIMFKFLALLSLLLVIASSAVAEPQAEVVPMRFFEHLLWLLPIALCVQALRVYIKNMRAS